MTRSRDVRTGKPDDPEVGGRTSTAAAHQLPPEGNAVTRTRTIVLTGARGGQGTTTVAAALALFAADRAPTMLLTDDPAAAAALLGIPTQTSGAVNVTPSMTLAAIGRDTPAIITVVDAGGKSAHPSLGLDLLEDAERYVVLRGPCYLSLASMLNDLGPLPDGVIVIAEEGRSLTSQDVADVLGVPVVAVVAAGPAVFRAIDAGLLLSRLGRLRELSDLRTLATTVPTRRPPHPARHPSSTSLSTHTDLPRPQSGRCGNPCRVAKR